jgi:hypothetical protein
MCPHCGQSAPIVYRGVVPYCTACGGLRAPFAHRSINLAGKPAKVGGTVARVFGWLVLVFGWSIALGVGLLAYALATVTVGLAVGLPVAVVTTAIAWMLLASGRSLRRSGAALEKGTRLEAVFALAANRRGVLTAPEVAQVLGTGVEESDALLTDLAKQDPDRVVVDVGDDGVVYYRFPAIAGAPIGPWHAEERVRVAQPEPQAAPHARVIDGELVEEEAGHDLATSGRARRGG